MSINNIEHIEIGHPWLTDERYKTLLKRGLYLLRRQKDNKETEDFIQEAILSLIESGFEFSDDESMIKAFSRRLRHIRIDQFRKFNSPKRDKSRLKPISPAHLNCIEGNTSSPEHVATLKEEFGNMMKVLSTLSDQTQKIIHLRFIENKKVVEIAEQLSLTVNMVSRTIHRTLKILKDSQ